MRSLFILTTLIAFSCCLEAKGGAKEHFINGQEYYEQGRYKDAIDEFDKAYRLDAKPLLLYNIAQAYEKLGNLRKSVDYLRRFLDSGSDKMDLQSIESKIANLEIRIKETGITVTVSEDGADIYVDDTKIATSPAAGVLPLEEGMHKVRISKNGFKDFTMNVGVSTGHSVPVDAVLEAADDSYVPARPQPEPVSEGTGIPVISAAAPVESDGRSDADGEGGARTEPSDDKGAEPLDVIPWVVAGVGAAAAIAGLGVLGSMALSNDDHDMANLADFVGWPGVAIAAGGAAWGVARLIGKKKNEDGAVSILPFAHPRAAGVSASMAF